MERYRAGRLVKPENLRDLTYNLLHEFVQKHGKVDVLGQPTAASIRPDGSIDVHRLIENDATHFRFNGKTYLREEFLHLLRATQSIN